MHYELLNCNNRFANNYSNFSFEIWDLNFNFQETLSEFIQNELKNNLVQDINILYNELLKSNKYFILLYFLILNIKYKQSRN